MIHRSNHNNFYHLNPIVLLSNLDHQENNKNLVKHSSSLPNIKLSKKNKVYILIKIKTDMKTMLLYIRFQTFFTPKIACFRNLFRTPIIFEMVEKFHSKKYWDIFKIQNSIYNNPLILSANVLK